MVRAASGRRPGNRVGVWALAVALAVPLVHLLQLSPAQAAPSRQAAPAARPRTKAAAASRPKAAVRAPSPATPPPPATAAPASPAASVPAAKAAGAKPEAPVSAPGVASASATAVVRTEDKSGEKTYTFGAQEVEGRLKSPQILYFLRRVRAQFDPAPLGHRSFLLELSDTRRHPAFE